MLARGQCKYVLTVGCHDSRLGLVRHAHAFEAGPAELPYYRAGYLAVADGLTFIVRGHRIGREVRFGGFAGIDASPRDHSTRSRPRRNRQSPIFERIRRQLVQNHRHRLGRFWLQNEGRIADIRTLGGSRPAQSDHGRTCSLPRSGNVARAPRPGRGRVATCAPSPMRWGFDRDFFWTKPAARNGSNPVALNGRTLDCVGFDA
jgi:hypothetical protein